MNRITKRAVARSLAFALTATVVSMLAQAAPAQAAPTRTDTRDNAQIRRFALVVGANHGGADRVTLRYANTDAQNFARVLQELGGVAASDVVLLRDPDRAALDRGFERVRANIAASAAATGNAAVRSELIVYYSGHSDEHGLLMYGERYLYTDLRRRIRSMPSDVNIAVLDSCASGALTRRKGGVKKPPFLVDHAVKVKGYAFLTSSSADEAAQESDRIAASYFTHYLVSGMRGGADANHDARVTLNEAYQFAFGETVARTRSTRAGPQHPAYDIHLVGTGDVVLTDLRTTDAALVFAAELHGRLFVHDRRGRLVIELAKDRGQPTVLGVEADAYDVTLRQGERTFRARVNPRPGARTPVAHMDFLEMATEPTVARGSDSAGSVAGNVPLLAVGQVGAAPAGSDPVTATPRPRPHTVHVPISLQVVPMGHVRAGTVNHLQLSLLVGQGHRLFGVEMSGLVNIREGHVGGIQIAGLANVNDGDALALQAAGIANVADGHMRGIQVGGIANVADGHMTGIQVGGIANVVDRDFTGLQVGGIANVTDGHMSGLQVALINVGGVVRGGQIGLINVADRVHGFQLGLVNVSEDAVAPIGLFSYAGKGRFDLEAWTSDTTPLSVGIKLGSRRVYGMLSVASDDERYLFGWGLGLHTPYQRFYVDVDALAYTVTDHELGDADNDALGSLRVAVGTPVGGGLALFGGLALTGAMAFDGKDGGDMSFLKGATISSSDTVIRLTPGFFAGISY